MSCLPYGTRFYKGRISRTANRLGGRSYIKGSVTNINKALAGGSGLISKLGMALDKVPFYKRIFRPQGRGG